VLELGQRFVKPGVVIDPGISTLPDVYDTTTMGKHLRQALSYQCGEIESIQLRILKHHPGSRCTFEVALRAAKGLSCLIGKVYATDRSDVYRAMGEIKRAGFGPEEECSIPEPLAYFPALRFLLLEKVQGTQAKQIFLTGDKRNRAGASLRCARWLARFHAIAPRSGRVSDLTNHTDPLKRWSRRIAKLGEPFASQARRLSERLEQKAASTNGGQLCAGHGSYSCNQIILTEGRTVTFDWDSYDVADPCRDVARFIVALQRLAFKYLGSIRELDATSEVFLKTYKGLSPFEVTANLSWYRALTCLRLAKYEANRPVCTLPEGIKALLGEGLRVLEQ
jgi:hypothetical protein